MGLTLVLMTTPESSNMLIMTLAHARASGDGTIISRHVSLEYSDIRTSADIVSV